MASSNPNDLQTEGPTSPKMAARKLRAQKSVLDDRTKQEIFLQEAYERKHQILESRRAIRVARKGSVCQEMALGVFTSGGDAQGGFKVKVVTIIRFHGNAPVVRVSPYPSMQLSQLLSVYQCSAILLTTQHILLTCCTCAL